MTRPSETEERIEFNAAIEKRHGNSFTLPKGKPKDGQEEDDVFDLPFGEVAPTIPESPGRPLHVSPDAEVLLNAEVLLPQGGELRLAKLIQKHKDSNGKSTGDYNKIPMLNTVVYDVQFPDGAVKQYSANIIAENILRQVDADRYHSQLLEGILEHKKNSRTVEKKDQWIVSKRSKRSTRKTTVGWKFRVRGKDGSITWEPLNDLKESYPVEVAEYANARGIKSKPVFAW